MNEININRAILKYVAFWTMTTGGLLLFAITILVPLMKDNQEMAYEHDIIQKQVSRIKQAYNELEVKTSAIGKDPQFTERVIRKELNIPEKGVETISVSPEKIKFPAPAASDNYWILDHEKNWWLRPFLNTGNKPWLMIISAGLILGAIISSARSASEF